MPQRSMVLDRSAPSDVFEASLLLRGPYQTGLEPCLRGYVGTCIRLQEKNAMAREPQDTPVVENQTRARQGVTGHNVRYVLVIGMALAIVAGVILYFTVGR